MNIKEKIKSLLDDREVSVQYETDTRYYNESYFQLIKAGSALKENASDEAAIIYLATGLLAWNKGATQARYMSHFINDGKSTDNSSLKNLISEVKFIESNGVPADGRKKIVERILKLSQAAFNIKDGVVIASKLIHFLSPQFFAMTDSNIDECIDGTTVPEGFVDYINALWGLNFHKAEPTNSVYKKYWAKSPEITPMRAFDCTFYMRGKHT